MVEKEKEEKVDEAKKGEGEVEENGEKNSLPPEDQQ